MATMDDVDRPGRQEELPTTEEFFLPGSGASRGLTSQDLEASRTATWDDNMTTIEDLEPPGPGSEELPYTEEFFLPGSGATRGLTSQDLEASRTATWDDPQQTMSTLDPDDDSGDGGGAPAVAGTERERSRLESAYGQPNAQGMSDDEADAAAWDEEAQAFLQELGVGGTGADEGFGTDDDVTARPGSFGDDAGEQGDVDFDDPALMAEQMIMEGMGTQRKRRGPIVDEPVVEDVPDFSGEEIVLVAGASMVPHPDKAATGGEDAYFISTARNGAVAVADGVGSWVMDGVNPAEFPRQLVSNLQDALGKVEWQGTEDGLRPVLQAAHAAATAPGSATVIVAAAGEGGVVHVANLGDCGLRVVRDGACTFATTDMLHDYNTPYQLGRVEENEEEYYTDSPDEAELYDIEVGPGDALVIASDGLFDNLFDEEIARITDQLVNGEQTVRAAERAAAALSAAATVKIQDSLSRTPWIDAAARAGQLPPLQRVRPRGGKVDDITVVVVVVRKAP